MSANTGRPEHLVLSGALPLSQRASIPGQPIPGQPVARQPVAPPGGPDQELLPPWSGPHHRPGARRPGDPYPGSPYPEDPRTGDPCPVDPYPDARPAARPRRRPAGASWTGRAVVAGGAAAGALRCGGVRANGGGGGAESGRAGGPAPSAHGQELGEGQGRGWNPAGREWSGTVPVGPRGRSSRPGRCLSSGRCGSAVGGGGGRAPYGAAGRPSWRWQPRRSRYPPSARSPSDELPAGQHVPAPSTMAVASARTTWLRFIEGKDPP